MALCAIVRYFRVVFAGTCQEIFLEISGGRFSAEALIHRRRRQFTA
jgi:hypothetical protein